jgi:hypothetical protein
MGVQFDRILEPFTGPFERVTEWNLPVPRVTGSNAQPGRLDRRQNDSFTAVNRLLKGHVSAKFSPVSALAMGLFVLDLFRRVKGWPQLTGELMDVEAFLRMPNGPFIVLDLFGVAVAGGMFVVPLYAFLTTTVPKSETARTIAANNIVNSGFMVAATLILTIAVQLGVTVADSLLIVAIASLVAAALAWRLHRACD